MTQHKLLPGAEINFIGIGDGQFEMTVTGTDPQLVQVAEEMKKLLDDFLVEHGAKVRHVN